MSLIATNATIIGSKVKVKRGSKINSITVKIGNVKYGLGYGTTGRHLGLAYWVIDKNFNKCNMRINPNNPPKGMHWFESASSPSISGVNTITYGDGITYSYINTNLIPGDTSENVTFTFEKPEEITESEIFVALIATRGLTTKDLDDVKYAWTCYDKKESGILYSKVSPVDSNDMLSLDMSGALNVVNVDVTLPSSDTSGNSRNKPKPIYCKRISYRTWSAPLKPGAAGTMDDKTHQIAVADGGEKCGYLYNSTNRNIIIKNNKVISIDSQDVLPYIMNDGKEDKFIDDFKMPMGRLSDVEYSNPSKGGLLSNNIIQPRWCFKRSRIKFEIPGISNSKYGTIVQYLVRTPISEKGIYSIEPKYKFYNKTETQNGFSIVICPRDEGVLDNMPFEVVFTRYYANNISSKIGYKSDDSVYKFHTYQKPIVNITYPKIIRNSSTWTENGTETRNFKYAKIPTSNIYSCFDGEQANRNKYVCDALNILFSTPKNDDSGIPMFVRFYVAEFKYGRDGCFGTDENNPISIINTTQDLFKSRDKNKYTTLNAILNGTTSASDCTAYLTNIFKNDGSPLLLSGRFNDETLKEVGNKYQLWTFNTWDYVVDDEEDENKRKQLKLPLNDVRVFNAWEYKSYLHDENGLRLKDSNGKPIPINIAKEIVGDHKDRPIKIDSYADGDAKEVSYPTCKMLLFRAGYCYLIRIRMFHGAASGAISKKYGKTNETCIGKEGTGDYTYKGAVYEGIYPIEDGTQYGNNNPYNKWHGPDDGTSGLSLSDAKLNETFPGFSQVDYTIFEATAPYSSLSNLITVHPTSPNISINQCLSFNYRHLAKNIGAIESNIFDGRPDVAQRTKNGYFGKTFGGIHNTISRIMAMYTSCAETILTKYFNRARKDDKGNNIKSEQYYNTKKMSITDLCTITNADETTGEIVYKVNQERLTLKVIPINNRTISDNDSNLSYAQTNKMTYNVPLINKYNVAAINTLNDMFKDKDFYTHNYDTNDKNGVNFIPDTTTGVIYRCGCYEYNNYRKSLQIEDEAGNTKPNMDKINANSPGDTYISPKLNDPNDPNKDVWLWPERNIIYKTIKQNYKGLITEEPLGNTYRWQPVINAIQYDNNENNKEIQIQNKNNATFNQNLNIISNGTNRNATINCDTVIYMNPDGIDGDIQRSYFYEDNGTQTFRTTNNATQINLSNNSSHRFCINEFSGELNGNNESAGNPVMQSMPSRQGTNNYSKLSYKYFDISDDLKSYGKLFTRVPTNCDCENGFIPENGNTINFGSLGRFRDNSIVPEVDEIYSLDSNGNNVYPLVRTTHYLYFKTYINVAFNLEINVEVQYTPKSKCNDWEEPIENSSEKIKHHDHTKELTLKELTFYLSPDGNNINVKSDSNTESNNIILFGNNHGIAEVYGEDNNGWGRCLSADDQSALKFKPDGGLHALPLLLSTGSDGSSSLIKGLNPNEASGGIEVPLLVRYTPLLQPKLISETIKDKTYTSVISKNVTIKEDKYYKISKVLFNYGDDEIETDSIALNINYPYIPEDETYTTRPINAGYDNIYFNNYHVDNDTDTPNSRTKNPELFKLSNMDFLGGYGICTAYTILLVPNDPDLTNLTSKKYSGYNNKNYLTNDEISKYFNNTDNHWNYFKQPNNYYKSGHIYGIRSKSQPKAGPVLVAYNVQLNEANKGEFLNNNNVINNGRNNQSISLNINNLRKCKVYYENKWISNTEFKKETGIVLNSVENKLNTGLIYDLVIVPIYSNKTDTSYNWTKTLAGTINNQSYGSNKDKEVENVHFAGSNPLVIFNYLQVNSNIIDNTGGGGDGGGDIDPDPQPDEPKDVHKIHNTDGAIIFPNVDHEQFNQTNGKIKESPGFWLNNSFRLVLRLPSYRTNDTLIDDIDNVTIENASNGNLNSSNTANDFLFKDIQIHIGKISELNKYGYPNEMESNLNKIETKDELAKLHIISYKDYYADDVFSKRLDNQFQNDVRELATAGALNPLDERKDKLSGKIYYDYKNRFIEVNLSNVTIKDDNNNDVPIYTKYPEGFYIQFRVQAAYPSDDGTCSWSQWYGGSIDGGSHWWGTNGTDYYVPVRNYSEIFTDFRNYIKESYPGTYAVEKGFLDDLFENNKKYINIPINNNPEDNNNIPTTSLFGKGSLLSHAGINDDSKTKPKSSIRKTYYKQGLGNTKETSIVGSEQIKSTVTKCITKELTKNGNYKYKEKSYDIQKDNDWPYKGTEQYVIKHDGKSNLLKDDTSRLWEMLYIDFIIRNMSKLYYKPKYNNSNDQWNGSDDRNKILKYHLSVPYDENNKPIVLNDKTWGWDDTEYNLFKTNDKDGQYKDSQNNILNNQLVVNEDKSSETNHIDGLRKKYITNKGYWDLNKYYRKPITKNDFDELNQHLIDLTNFIGHSLLTGKNNDNSEQPMIENTLSIKASLLEFNKTRKAIMGNSTNIGEPSGIGIVNNLTNQLTDYNYIQKIWTNIKLFCQCENDSTIEK